MTKFRFFLYQFLTNILLPLFMLIFLLNGLIKRRNYIPLFHLKKENGKNEQYLWIQAASAGEVQIARTMMEAFKTQLTEIQWLIITTTHSGYLMAQQIFKEQVEVVYLPGDFSFLIRRLFKCYPPIGFWIIENEIWANLIYWLWKRRIKLAMLNGRVNDRTWRRYRRMKYFLYATLKLIDLFCVQTERDARRLIHLGALPEQVHITGNAKYDQNFDNVSEEKKAQLIHELGLNDGTQLFIAGSTHAGEEEIILKAFYNICKSYPKVLLILAPRHLNRISDLKEMLSSQNLNYEVRSLMNGIRKAQIVILDTFGELSHIYGLACFAFVGGSLVPIGGHNLLEPVAQGCPVFFGPYTQNFSEIAELLTENGVGFEVHDSCELALGGIKLLNDLSLRRTLGEKAQNLTAAQRGATQQMAEMYIATLKKA